MAYRPYLAPTRYDGHTSRRCASTDTYNSTASGARPVLHACPHMLLCMPNPCLFHVVTTHEPPVKAGVDRFVPWQLDFLVSQPGPRPAANFLHVRYGDCCRDTPVCRVCWPCCKVFYSVADPRAVLKRPAIPSMNVVHQTCPKPRVHSEHIHSSVQSFSIVTVGLLVAPPLALERPPCTA